MRKFKEIFNKLGMNSQNGLYITTEDKWKGFLSPRIGWLIEEKLKPAAFFCIDKKPIVLFYDSPRNKKDLYKAIWNFNESPVVIINEPDTVEILNGFKYLKDKETLETLEDGNNLNDFSYFKLVTGTIWQTYENKLKYQNKVDYHLLENIKSARNLLINEYQIDPYLSNALIGKCIFIRYLIDRKVRIGFDGNLRGWTNDDFCNLLKDKNETIKFLNYLNSHFNGEAFLVEDKRLNKIPKEAFDILSRLMQGVEIATDQMSLFDIYDFSIIPVEFISNVYEHFIGIKNQAKKGAYYTPLFLVDYIISETIEKFFNDHPKEYNCKTLDPACGSGVFIVEALRRMIERYKEINNIASPTTKSFKSVLRKIAEDNIYGIDRDDNAINVAIFSVYLALLDYQEPKDIENFSFPSLKNKNFFIGDFFDLKANFNKNFKEINFDFILGNPPWKRGSDSEALFLTYINQRRKAEKEDAMISNKEIAQAFLLRTRDFVSAKTKCALIVTSKTLYNLNAKGFRRYFLKNHYLESVLELSPVGTEIFQSANTPPAVLFYRCSFGSETNKNIVKHIVIKPNRLFSLFNIFALQRNDCKNVAQKKLIENDWLWKVLIWGSYLDFNFLKRLKNGNISINGAIGENNLLVGQGIIIGDKDKKYNVYDLIGKPLIDHKKDIKQFHVCASLLWTEEKVTRDRNKELFKAPILLIKHGLKRLKAVAAISNSDVLYQHSLTGIKGDIAILRTLCGLLNSDLFSYYMIHASVAGTDRGRAHDEEKFDFPYISNIQITEYVKKIEVISKKMFEQKQNILNSKLQLQEDEKQHLVNDLNDEILKSFDLNEQEKALVGYAATVTIPLIMKHYRYENELFLPIQLKGSFLKDYAEIFISRFKSSFEKCKKAFRIQILHNNYIIGMFFRVTNQAKKSESVSWESKSEDEMLLKLSSLGYQKITENLFIQKDIRGFEKDGFYIIKPNEKKLWHKAIAYLDAEEFADAMLKEGIKEKQNV